MLMLPSLKVRPRAAPPDTELTETVATVVAVDGDELHHPILLFLRHGTASLNNHSFLFALPPSSFLRRIPVGVLVLLCGTSELV
jgi:hypothetical protein